MKQAQKFLVKGNQVRVTLTLKGRQKGRPEQSVDFLNELYETYFVEYGRLSKRPSESNLGLTLNPL